MNALHDFKSDLAFSHASEGAAFWREVYERFFPGHAAVIRHSEDGDWQRLGVDSSVIMPSSKVFTVDEKVRRRDYPDIALEEWSDFDRGIPGWIQKRLLSDYLLYVVLPAGRAYLLPVLQTQEAWRRHGEEWKATREPITALNRDPRTGRAWESISWGIAPEELFPAIGAALRATFPEPFAEDSSRQQTVALEVYK